MNNQVDKVIIKNVCPGKVMIYLKSQQADSPTGMEQLPESAQIEFPNYRITENVGRIVKIKGHPKGISVSQYPQYHDRQRAEQNKITTGG
jgi:hypothetical protein